jgi:TolA-binding protein
MAQFPSGSHTAPAVLLAGQAVALRSNPTNAQEILLKFTKLAPSGPLLPSVHLAIARTYEEENDWADAGRQYDLCLTTFTNFPGVADAEYYRARANFLAGNETNALRLFTNFVARFPTNEFHPQAQLWIGDYYYNLGDYRDAELNYKPLFENASVPKSRLYYQGLMMAGRAAFQQQLWNNAVPYFTNLTGDASCPETLWVEAVVAYGDCLMSQLSRNPADTNNAANLRTAIGIFSQACERYPTNRQAVLALGEKGNALMQLALCTGQAEYFTNALEAYQQVISNRTDFPARSMAKVGQGVVLEKLADSKTGAERTALLNRALEHYLDVYDEGILAGQRDEPFWTVKAGLEAIRLAEALQMWPQAIAICQQLRELYPPLRATLDQRIEVLKDKQRHAAAGR